MLVDPPIFTGGKFGSQQWFCIEARGQLIQRGSFPASEPLPIYVLRTAQLALVTEIMIIKPVQTGFFLLSRATTGAYCEYLSSQFLIALDVLLPWTYPLYSWDDSIPAACLSYASGKKQKEIQLWSKEEFAGCRDELNLKRVEQTWDWTSLMHENGLPLAFQAPPAFFHHTFLYSSCTILTWQAPKNSE